MTRPTPDQTPEPDTQASRQRAVREAIHSGEMEGLFVGEEFERDAAEYVSGAIDLDEFSRRVFVRTGAEPDAGGSHVDA
jgi:hypothetical protein